MRLFIAINLDESVRDKVCKMRDELADLAQECRPSRRENLHITLAFLGDVPPSKAAKIQKGMEKSANNSFNLVLSGLGSFRRREGDICWLGVEHEPELWSLAGALNSNLRAEGFQSEEREFRPHLTLCRNVVMKNSKTLHCISVERLIQTVEKIELMESSRINGVLTYTPLVSVLLNG